MYLNLKNLKFIFGDYEETNIVVKVEDWLSNDPEKCEYFTVSELIEDRHFACLNVIIFLCLLNLSLINKRITHLYYGELQYIQIQTTQSRI